ncbi:hypothetical protein AMECASPLE_012132 [Ameca splendens]|uniref:Uncharacterized protein n=1 Tax=Ameca splendens TaxID=208324 RepID=A0ABV0YCD0_9TELE
MEEAAQTAQLSVCETTHLPVSYIYQAVLQWLITESCLQSSSGSFVSLDYRQLTESGLPALLRLSILPTWYWNQATDLQEDPERTLAIIHFRTLNQSAVRSRTLGSKLAFSLTLAVLNNLKCLFPVRAARVFLLLFK